MIIDRNDDDSTNSVGEKREREKGIAEMCSKERRGIAHVDLRQLSYYHQTKDSMHIARV